MDLKSFLTAKKETFTGKVKRISHVMTSSSEVVFYGVLFWGEEKWIRVATNDIGLAERIAFLQPDEVVSITVQGSIMQVKSNYHRLVMVDIT